MRSDRAVAERAGVGHETNLARRLEFAPKHVVAPLGKAASQRQACLMRVELPVLLVRLRAEQPARLVVERPGLELEVAPTEEDRAGGEKRLVRTEALVLRKPRHVAVVAVAELRYVSGGVHDGGEVIEHRFDARGVFRREAPAVR